MKNIAIALTALIGLLATHVDVNAQNDGTGGWTMSPFRINPVTGVLNRYLDVPEVRNVVCVMCTDGSNATVKVFSKDAGTDAWTMTVETDGYIGRNGCTIDKAEGDGKSPIGDFGIVTAFGIKEKPQTQLDYIAITPTIYAVDTDNPYYNHIIDTAEGGPAEGEHMCEYTDEYSYGIALDYNPECVYGKGSNIFFHCKGTKPSTAGCVAVDEDVVLYLLRTLTPHDRICIMR